MKFLGIHFAPLRVPLERRLQTLAVAAWFHTMVFGGPLCWALFLYLFVFTQLRGLLFLYLLWMLLDRKTAESGGRSIGWLRRLTWWKYLRDYFPLQFSLVPGSVLDPHKNYLFCCVPHGVLPTGLFNIGARESPDCQRLFPHHRLRGATLPQHFSVPFFREFLLGLSAVSCSLDSLNYMLSRPGGGWVCLLTPGGAAESYKSQPGTYKTLIRQRKGFVKVALANGAPLVPLISFGETSHFDQVQGPKLYRVQEFLRRYIGMAPLVLNGRGFFQYSFGLIPRRGRVFTLIGRPIDVERVERPTKAQVDQLHERFVLELQKLFEEHKHQYCENPERTFLEIE